MSGYLLSGKRLQQNFPNIKISKRAGFYLYLEILPIIL